MRFVKNLWTFSTWCFASIFFVSTNTFGQAAVSQDDSTKVLLPATALASAIPGEPPSQSRVKIPFTLETDRASILRKTAKSDPHPDAWTSSDSHFNLGTEQNANSNESQSNPGRKIRKGPLILGIAGAAVAVVGIAVAAGPCGLGPCLRTGGIVAAGVGGGVAVTGFYFAFRR